MTGKPLTAWMMHCLESNHFCAWLRFSVRLLNKLKLAPPACPMMARQCFALDVGEAQTCRWAVRAHEKAHKLLSLLLL